MFWTLRVQELGLKKEPLKTKRISPLSVVTLLFRWVNEATKFAIKLEEQPWLMISAATGEGGGGVQSHLKENICVSEPWTNCYHLFNTRDSGKNKWGTSWLNSDHVFCDLSWLWVKFFFSCLLCVELVSQLNISDRLPNRIYMDEFCYSSSALVYNGMWDVHEKQCVQTMGIFTTWKTSIGHLCLNTSPAAPLPLGTSLKAKLL